MYSFYELWGWRLMIENQSMQLRPSYSQFRLAWLSYLQLIEIKDEWFSCPHCGPHPNVVVCDGISLGYPKRYVRSNGSANAAEHILLKGNRYHCLDDYTYASFVNFLFQHVVLSFLQ